MADYVNRIRKNREISVPVDKYKFTARRPTDVEALALYKGDGAYSSVAADFVVGWEGVSENDVVGGGSPDPIPFSPELWREWCADRPDFWEPIADAVLAAYRQHAEKLASAAKNSPAG